MAFYRLRNNSAHERSWMYAVSIRPTSPLVDWYCLDCGHSASYPSGSFDVVLEGGADYPDLLQCGAYPLLIVSDRVLEAWREAGIRSFQEYPVGIDSVESVPQNPKPPRYYRVEITGTCMIDFSASGAAIKKHCRRCGEIETDPMVIPRFHVLEGSWDSQDLFRDQRYFPRVSFCTQKLVDVVRAHSLTNFRFDRLG